MLVTSPLLMMLTELFSGVKATHVWSRAVLRHEGHTEMGAEQSSREPTSSFFRGELLPDQNGSLEDALTYNRHAAKLMDDSAHIYRAQGHFNEIVNHMMISPLLTGHTT